MLRISDVFYSKYLLSKQVGLSESIPFGQPLPIQVVSIDENNNKMVVDYKSGTGHGTWTITNVLQAFGRGDYYYAPYNTLLDDLTDLAKSILVENPTQTESILEKRCTLVAFIKRFSEKYEAEFVSKNFKKAVCDGFLFTNIEEKNICPTDAYFIPKLALPTHTNSRLTFSLFSNVRIRHYADQDSFVGKIVNMNFDKFEACIKSQFGIHIVPFDFVLPL